VKIAPKNVPSRVNHWSWKEGFRFALCWKMRAEKPAISLPTANKAELFGSWIVEPLYHSLDRIAHHIKKPFIVILFILGAALVTTIAFYNIPAFIFLGKILPGKVLRLTLFLVIEWIIFGMGCKAFGRFHNPALIELWKKGTLAPRFPGDK
jgi:hypothetical protein